ncbi:hypothetical protein [Ruegeria arenilitoris]|uniref:hypothetical protein n=1 Tax=Ruegeria arenilitoris TaxID=1173585 RepID=UPI00148010D8|nr:hypothetical protein [Ruegeria arenilitoris]
MIYRGIKFNLSFERGCGGEMPAGPGIYAEVHWPTMNIRIGESKNVRSRNRGHIRWADKHKAGTHKPEEANRKGPIVDLVKEWGSEGLEHFLISGDPRLSDRELRVECEKQLHEWARTQTIFVNMNRQRSYRTVN